MSQNKIIEQQVTGMLNALQTIPADQLLQQISQQYAENYNRLRDAAMSENRDITLWPPVLDIPPDGRPEANYLEVKTYCAQLREVVHGKVIIARAAHLQANPIRVIR